MTDDPVRVPEGSPPAALNSMMKLFLKTPGLQRWLGKGVALLTFTGRRSGKRYTIPVSYDRQNNTVVLVTKKHRTWWRNFASSPNVELRLAGQTFPGRATATVGEASSLEWLTRFLESRPIDARAYGVKIDASGQVDREQARRLLPQIVLVRITLR